MKNSKKHAYVTGIAGFLGSHLADYLLDKGYSVAGCDTLAGGYEYNVPAKAKFFKSDCGNLEEMTKHLEDVDVVYHCAAAPYEGLSVFSPTYVFQHCCQNTVAMVTASIRNKVNRFVYCSSMARYGSNTIPFKEEMEPHPQDPYGIAKYAGELALQNLSKVHGLDYVIAVPHNIIGSRQKYDDPFRNVVSIMINRMLQGKQPIIFGDGNQKRCFTFVSDIVHCLAAMGEDDRLIGQIVNIGPDEEEEFVTINELSRVTAELMQFKLEPIYRPPRPQEVYLATCSAEKARKLLNYRTTYTLRQGIQEMIEWISSKGAKPFTYHIDIEIVNDLTPKVWTKQEL